MSGRDGNAKVPRYPEPLAVRIPEACNMIGIGRSKLYEPIAEAAIEVVKLGRVTLIPVTQLKALIDGSK